MVWSLGCWVWEGIKTNSTNYYGNSRLSSVATHTAFFLYLPVMSCTMTNESNCSRANDDIPSLTQLELLEALIDPDGSYPWDPTDPESEAYFIEQEQKNSLLEDWSEEEIAVYSQAFFSQVEQIWEETDVKDLQTTLQQQFASYIPHNWLQAIAHRAFEVFSTHKSIADQLVQCAQDLLPNWAEDDLLVLARPFAYSMRGTDTAVQESVLANIRLREWTALSEVEQARVYLAIAKYALVQIQNSHSPSTDKNTIETARGDK